MLPDSVRGKRVPSREILRRLARGDIHPISRVTIYRKYEGNWIPTEVTNVLDYTISEDRAFGASSLTLTGANKNGEYSYSNTTSDKNTLYVNATREVQVLLSGGTGTNVKFVSGGLKLIEPSEPGVWVSDVVEGGPRFHSWRGLVWDIDPGVVVRSVRYYGTVNIYIRYGDTIVPDAPGSNWTPWHKIDSISGHNVSLVDKRTFISTSPFAQIKLELVAAFDTVSPTVKRFSLTSFDRDGVIANVPLYYYGNRIVVEEGIVSDDGSEIEWFDAFNGFIDTVDPSQDGPDATIRCDALDWMYICLKDYIEVPGPDDDGRIFEAEKIRADRIQLQPVPFPGHDDNDDGIYEVPVLELEDGTTEENSVFRVPIEYRGNGPIRGYLPKNPPPRTGAGDKRGDFMYQPWAERPSPTIWVDGKMLDKNAYQIDYQRGVVYFPEKKEDSNGKPLKVEATFYWYDLDTNLFEDVVGEIIARAMERFGFVKPRITTSTDDYVIWAVPGDASAPKIILERSNPRVTVPPTSFFLDDKKTFFDALEEVLRYTSPDYILRATPEGNFVGEYLPQKEKPDYTLSLIESINAPISEQDIYTRCIARGVLPAVANVAIGGVKRVIEHLSPNYSSPNRFSANIMDLFDGDLNSNVGWHWISKGGGKGHRVGDDGPELPLPLFTIELRQAIYLGGINVLGGDGIGIYNAPIGWFDKGARNIQGIGFRIEVSSDNVNYYSLTTQDTHEVASAQWAFIDKDDFHEDVKNMKVKYIRFIATSVMGPFDYGSAQFDVVWNWALREVQIYPDEVFMVEVSLRELVESNQSGDSSVVFPEIPKHVADDLEERLGVKTLILPVDPSLRSEEMARARAMDYLYEMSRNLYTSDVQCVYAPHVQIGHTVTVQHKTLIDQGARNYYVEGIERTMSEGSPSVRLRLVSWV